ncbi:GH18334 [Drosophila grimshawi]|uniref:GH18334 n=1 Tax=Drosophila grimshawi TaxID=7222 RepID=B4JSD1_DROGR|nr:GH18334 [Drosophila grimshawi]
MQNVAIARYNTVNRMPQGGHFHNNHDDNRHPLESNKDRRTRQTMARDINKYMNLSVDPCVDFYEYACGNWSRYHNRQLREGQLITAQRLVELGIEEQLQELLTLPLPPQNHPNEYSATSAANVRKVRTFYDACIAIEANAAERRQFLMKILRDHGGLRNIPNSHWKPNYHWLQVLASLRRNYGLDILIGLDVDLNLQQLRGNSVYLGEPQLTIIPAEHCNARITRQSNVRDEIYEEIQEQVADNMRNWFAMESGEAARFAGDIVRFEFELCKRMREQEIILVPPAVDSFQQEMLPVGRSRIGQDRLRQQNGGAATGSSLYPRMTLIELTSKLGNSLDFKLYVESILEDTYSDYVYLRSQSYLQHLVRTAKANNQVTISGYILYRALLELDQPPVVEQAIRRPRQCVQVLQRLFPQVLGDMYQRHVHRDDAQQDMEQIFTDVVKAFEQQLHVDWLDETDRRTARTRLSQYHIQWPDYQDVSLASLQFLKTGGYWQRLETALHFNAREQLNSLRGNDFGRTATGSEAVNAFEVRASLVQRQHAVLVGWGLMQAPYYSYTYPRAMRYALLGQRLASALLQGFDDEGWNRDAQATTPWNDITMSGYRNVSECQRAQYSNYLSNDPDEFRNATRLREIIADGSALNVAFNAYLNWLTLMDHKSKALLLRETLPGLNFSNTQLFFIYFAQTRCWARRDEEPASEALPLMQHTPQRWDVNGPLSNSDEFGREFNCALGSPMNSGNKCLIY